MDLGITKAIKLDGAVAVDRSQASCPPHNNNCEWQQLKVVFNRIGRVNL